MKMISYRPNFLTFSIVSFEVVSELNKIKFLNLKFARNVVPFR